MYLQTLSNNPKSTGYALAKQAILKRIKAKFVVDDYQANEIYLNLLAFGRAVTNYEQFSK